MAKRTQQVDLNEASAQELVQANIPGVDMDVANSIIEYRNENGPFETWEEVRSATRMSEVQMEAMRSAGVKISSLSEEEEMETE